MSDGAGSESSVPKKKRRVRKMLRVAIRLTVFGVALASVVPWFSWSNAERVLPALSPFMAIGSTIALRDVSSWSLVAVPILVAALITPRLFCRYACPMGLLVDCAGCTRVGKPLVKYLPNIGKALAIGTWLLAIIGLPAFLFLDPLAMFSAMFGHGPYLGLAIVGVCVLGVSLILPKWWCVKACPLGATQDLVRMPIAWARCLATRGENVAEDDAKQTANPMDRRLFLETTSALALLAVGFWWARRFIQPMRDATAKPLRPPGAAEPLKLATLCTRCGNCANVCPTGIIRPDYAPEHPPAIGAPMVVLPDDRLPTDDASPKPTGYCRHDCTACGKACPSGAIADLPLEKKQDWKIGLASIDLDLCIMAYDGRECSICVRACPREAVTSRWSEDAYAQIPIINAEKCNGCGACLTPCPGYNDWELENDPTTPIRKAIVVQPFGSVMLDNT